jgi:hypothetical protein
MCGESVPGVYRNYHLDFTLRSQSGLDKSAWPIAGRENRQCGRRIGETSARLPG